MAYSIVPDPFTGLPSRVEGTPSYTDLESIADLSFQKAAEYGDSGIRDGAGMFEVPGVGSVQAHLAEQNEDGSYVGGSKYYFTASPLKGDPGYTGDQNQGGSGYMLMPGEDGKIAINPESRYERKTNIMNMLPAIGAALVTGGMASSAMGAGGVFGGAGAGSTGAAGGAAGASAIPTAAELTAAGMSPGGMGLTGAGGIGSASSVAGGSSCLC